MNEFSDYLSNESEWYINPEVELYFDNGIISQFLSEEVLDDLEHMWNLQ